MRTPALLAAAAALLLAAAPAFAQSDAAPAASPRGQGHAGRMGHAGGHGDWRAKFAAMRQQRMQDLRVVLRIRPEQETAWQAYQAALAPPEHGARDHAQHGQGAQAAPQTTPQALDHMAAWRAERDQRMVVRTEATKRFYAALSPEQQQVFDALRRLSHHRGGRGGHGFGGRMGGMERG
ncbi:MAG: Spy/CpxP family protein refolding chaperone [Caulobacteraceae bacterium]